MTDTNPIDSIVDNILMGDSALDITNSIKDALFVKAASRIDASRPDIYNSIFDAQDVDEQVYVEGEYAPKNNYK